MNAAPILLLGAAAAAFLLLSNKSSSAASSPAPDVGPGGTDPKLDAACTAALKRVKDAATAAASASAALAKNPNDAAAKAALLTAQQAGQAAVAMWPKSCGDLPAFSSDGQVIANTQKSGGAVQTTSNPNCNTEAFHNLAVGMNQAGAVATMSPSAATYASANAAVLAVKQAAAQWQANGCPANQDVAAAAALLANWQPDQAPAPTRTGPFASDKVYQVVKRPASVPRLSGGQDLLFHGGAWTTNSGPINDSTGTVVWNGPFCGPDIQFGRSAENQDGSCPPGYGADGHGMCASIWPIASVGFVERSLGGTCTSIPVAPGTPDIAKIQSTFGDWTHALWMASMNPSLAPADSAGWVAARQEAENYLAQAAPGAFLRYLAYLYVLFADALPELTDENEKAAANHVILVTDGLIRQMGGDPKYIPQLPAVWVPRQSDGKMIIPFSAAVNLYPGVSG